MVKNLPYVARLACTILFFILGNSIGCWVSAIPGFKEAFRLDNGQLGVAIMCSGIGSLVMTIPVGNFVAQHGPTSTIFTSSVLRPFFYLILPALAAWGFKPYLALFLISIVSAGSFISYNSRAHELEEIWGSPLLSSFQGALSVGGLTGSGFYSYLLSHGLSWGQATRLMYVLVGLFSFAAWLFVDFDMPPRRSQATGIHTCSSLATKSKSQGLAALSPTVLFLSLVGSFSSLCEGALGDWTSLYLQEYTHCPKHLAPFGFTAFSTSMGGVSVAGRPRGSHTGTPHTLRAQLAGAQCGRGGAFVCKLNGSGFGGVCRDRLWLCQPHASGGVSVESRCRRRRSSSHSRRCQHRNAGHAGGTRPDRFCGAQLSQSTGRHELSPGHWRLPHTQWICPSTHPRQSRRLGRHTLSGSGTHFHRSIRSTAHSNSVVRRRRGVTWILHKIDFVTKEDDRRALSLTG
eukprot:Gregarina_sp_Pseudo_9__6012@NODE_9_length_6712_cov_72_400270_g7_i0_p2_GENE_NODE_9_length_6712_cov_72_400270_g7_i0NODE_9_length_6712_cov_72_400270_g7_i0_p2_ORF_typecomplete_len474_score52_81MFS_1/PF07690_16/2_5e08Herpes_UL4/PF03277_13/3Herpes_UL4/PF03277_13/49_NODE_9_length_6712_cov_72_400270_g7_i0481424